MRAWSDVVLDAIRRVAGRQRHALVTRQALIEEELARIVSETGSHGSTPHQTLSRVLQDLRDRGIIAFQAPGEYLLLEETAPLEAAAEAAAEANPDPRAGYWWDGNPDEHFWCEITDRKDIGSDLK